MPEAAAHVRYLAIRWQMLWQLWVSIAVTLFVWQQSDQLPVTWIEVLYTTLAIVASSLLLTLLALLLRPEPLAICFNYQVGQVTYYRIGLPWHNSLPIGQLHCHISEQTSHSGRTHFLLVSGLHGQVWAIQESSGWPLARLKRLRELLTTDAQ